MWFDRLLHPKKDLPFDVKFNKHETGVFMTPDAPAMETKPHHLVFIYDDMMYNRPEYPAISYLVMQCLGTGLAEISVEAYISRETGRVIAMPAHNGARPNWSRKDGAYRARIRGNIFKMLPTAIKELDKLFGNNVYFQREEVVCDVWRGNPEIVEAWVYLAIPDKWPIDGGYEWQPLRINGHNCFTAQDHYYHTFRHTPIGGVR